jgi:hypothetical protein
MGVEIPRQTREGRLIEGAASVSGLSVKKLAANAGISDTRWRHIVRGWQPGPGGAMNPVVAPANTLARMALAVGVSAEDLIEAGRGDAAEVLPSVEARRLSDSGVDFAVMRPDGQVEIFEAKNYASAGQADEIELVYASRSMTAKQKLETIRMILQLRAEVEAEEVEVEAPKEAPADAEAPVEPQS